MYAIEPYPDVEEQIAALPETASAGYREAVEVLRLVPWNGQSLNKNNPDAEVRQLVFGPDGKGLVTYLILEDQQRVDVLQVTWMG